MIDVFHHFWSSRVARESSLESLSEKKKLETLETGKETCFKHFLKSKSASVASPF